MKEKSSMEMTAYGSRAGDETKETKVSSSPAQHELDHTPNHSNHISILLYNK